MDRWQKGFVDLRDKTFKSGSSKDLDNDECYSTISEGSYINLY